MRLILILSLVALSGCESKNCANKTSKIVSVGGCDKYGDCGVLLENGRKSRIGYPVVGEEVTYRKCE